jgi:hypothetical protein
VAISAGNEHDSLHFAAVADKIELKGIRGRPKRRPCEINADATFDTEDIRIYLRKRGIKANIPVIRETESNQSVEDRFGLIKRPMQLEQQ